MAVEMELIKILLLVSISIGVIIILYFISKIYDTVFDSEELHRQNQEIIATIKNTLQQTSDQTVFLETKIERLHSAIRASQPPNPPIKPNNWESMRKVFKAPMKGDSINE